MIGFWVDSHNLTMLTGLSNALTDELLTDVDVETITGELLGSNDEQVGDDIAFTYDKPGQWHAVWLREMTVDAYYTLKVTVIALGLTLTIVQQLPARYRGPTK